MKTLRLFKFIFKKILLILIKILKLTPITQKPIDMFIQNWLGFPFNTKSYYSPIPDMDLILRDKLKIHKESFVDTKNFNMDTLPEQILLLKKLLFFSNEISSRKHYLLSEEKGFGQGYGEIESYVYYSMIRHFKPKKIIEVGGGLSTYYAIRAIEKNKLEKNKSTQLICIEPFPFDELKNNKHSINLIEKKVQEVDSTIFKDLEEGDFLFIDSSHVGKVGSDVSHILLNIIPNLPKNCFIHFHDMYLPFTTTPDNHKIFNESCFWNEILIVSNFLNFNYNYKVIQSQSILHHLEPEKFKNTFPSYDPKINFPSSMWIQKI